MITLRPATRFYARLPLCKALTNAGRNAPRGLRGICPCPRLAPVPLRATGEGRTTARIMGVRRPSRCTPVCPGWLGPVGRAAPPRHRAGARHGMRLTP